MKLTTALDPKLLRFRSLRGSEEMGRLFEYEILAVSDGSNVDVDALLGKPAGVTVDLGPGAQRHYHGIVVRAGLDGSLGRENTYTLQVRPWMWLMTRSTDLRIFQNKDVKEILQQLLNEYSSDFEIQLDGSFPKREYCVQYRESDFDFISRLMEEEGIYYFFRHEAGKHVAVIVNAPGAHKPENDITTLPFRASLKDYPHRPVVGGWRFHHQVRSGKYVQTDYNFETPNKLPSHTMASGRAQHYEHDDLERYDFPGRFVDASGATHLTTQRKNEDQARFRRAVGETTTPALVAGAKFTLSEHPREDQNVAHVVVAQSIALDLAAYEAGVGTDTLVHCRFEAIVASETFRAESVTPKPRTRGPQTAVVVGPAGDEIHVDKHGRVKVQFHWDREGKSDENSTCYIRVAQRSAAKGWGMVWLPRIGHEVIVDFLEGDPDRPIVVGSVYNGVNMPPYTLPDNKTVSTIKSHSSKGGGANDFNEIRFEDLKGKEYVLEQAQKDKLEFVKNVKRSLISGSEHRTVSNSKDALGRREKIYGDHQVKIEKGGAKFKVEKKWSLTTDEDMLTKTGKTWGLTTGTDLTGKAGTAVSLESGTDMHLKIGTNLGAVAGVNVHIKGGVNVVVEAGVQLTLKGGAGSVVCGPDGVSITGPMVKINSGGAPGSGSGASPVKPTAPETPEDPELPQDPLSHFA